MKSTETNIVNNSQQPGNEYGRAVCSSVQRKTLNTDLAPIGDDIEPIEAPREDVEMRNDEDKEPLETNFPRARMNPKNPTSREKQDHEDSGHVVYRNRCTACVEGRGVGGQQRVELLKEEERE